jgi:hypothetical protein
MAWVGHTEYALDFNVFLGFLFILGHGTKASYQETWNWGPRNHRESCRSHFNKKKIPYYKAAKDFIFLEEQCDNM